MENIVSSDDYFRLMKERLDKLDIQNYPDLLHYFYKIKEDFYHYVNKSNPENFFLILSHVLRLDAKLVLLGQELEFIENYGLEQNEIIEIIERDSKYFNKEQCGYRVNEKPYLSLIFNAI